MNKKEIEFGVDRTTINTYRFPESCTDSTILRRPYIENSKLGLKQLKKVTSGLKSGVEFMKRQDFEGADFE